jgi:hypothetical protein
MFVKAIEEVLSFTRPIHTIARYWEGEEIEPSASTLFFVSNDGWALTCKHIAQVLFSGGEINARFKEFKSARNALKGKKSRTAIKQLGRKFGYKRGDVVEIHNRLCGCIEGKLDVEARVHPSVDVALLKFRNYTKLLCDKFPTFIKDSSALKAGKFLCRVGFPFVEFANFEHKKDTDEIRWTGEGKEDTPYFPMEGMLTRHLIDRKDLIGFELSTPGLRGQSGGPVFDTEGRIAGMQCATGHRDLNFDVKQDVFRSGRKEHATARSFLHVGQCVHGEILKDFMRKNNVEFAEG